MPVSVAQAKPSRFDGPPRVISLGFQLAGGRLVGPRDLFDDPGFDGARRAAGDLADHLRRHGPFEPHRRRIETKRGRSGTAPLVSIRAAPYSTGGCKASGP